MTEWNYWELLWIAYILAGIGFLALIFTPYN